MSKHNRERRQARRRQKQKEQDIGSRFAQAMYDEDRMEAIRQVRSVPILHDIAYRADNGDEDMERMLEVGARALDCAEPVAEAPTWMEAAALMLGASGRLLRGRLQRCDRGHLHCHCAGLLSDGNKYLLSVLRHKCGAYAFGILDVKCKVCFTQCTGASEEAAIDALAAHWVDFVFHVALTILHGQQG